MMKHRSLAVLLGIVVLGSRVMQRDEVGIRGWLLGKMSGQVEDAREISLRGFGRG